MAMMGVYFSLDLCVVADCFVIHQLMSGIENRQLPPTLKAGIFVAAASL
jgi:hypothetical protein